MTARPVLPPSANAPAGQAFASSTGYLPIALEPRQRHDRETLSGGADYSSQAWGNGITVLFAAKDSIYKKLGCDVYDLERNALTYRGNAPVVAHPPCQLWGKMAKINHLRWGGEHNRPGNDGGCFRFALDAVNRCGGVLEHPAETYAWLTHGLPYPGMGWTRWKQGWVCEVWQSAYGHRAQKRTWLYYFGEDVPLPARWERPPGTHQVGFHDQRGKARNKPTLSRREANATPIEFAYWLILLASGAARGSRGGGSWCETLSTSGPTRSGAAQEDNARITDQHQPQPHSTGEAL